MAEGKGTRHQSHVRPSARNGMMSKLWTQCICSSTWGIGDSHLSRVAWHPSSVLQLKGIHSLQVAFMSMGTIGRPTSVTPPLLRVSGRWVGGSEGGWMGLRVGGWVCGWVGGWVCGRVGGCEGGWVGLRVDGWVCGWVGGCEGGWMGVRVGGWV